jgi:hypothetical protein
LPHIDERLGEHVDQPIIVIRTRRDAQKGVFALSPANAWRTADQHSRSATRRPRSMTATLLLHCYFLLLGTEMAGAPNNYFFVDGDGRG